METLRAHVERQLRKGKLPTVAELRQYSEKNELSADEKSIERMLATWPGVPRLKIPRASRYAYFGMPYYRYGVIQIDLANYRPEWRLRNEGYGAFLVAVEVSTGQLHAEPMRKKDRPSFRTAIENILSTSIFDKIYLFQSDREPAIRKSQSFRKELLDDYGIRFHFLTARSKAFKAERYIRYVKAQLTRRVAMSSQRTSEMNWLRFLRPLVKEYNNRVIKNTDYKRRDVDSKNYLDYLAQKWDISRPYSYFNIAHVPAAAIKNKKWLDKAFRFDLGDRVLILIKLRNLLEPPSRRSQREVQSIFDTVTVKGKFSSRIFVIARRSLRHTKDLSLIPGKCDPLSLSLDRGRPCGLLTFGPLVFQPT